MERFASGEGRKESDKRDDYIPEEHELPSELPRTPELDPEPQDITPQERQNIIDDMNEEDEKEHERQERIREIIEKRKGGEGPRTLN